MSNNKRMDLIVGLRELADFLEDNPEAPAYLFDGSVSLSYWCDSVDEMVDASCAIRGRLDKVMTPHSFMLRREFGDGLVRFQLSADRSTVCERKVVGTERVKETVPDAEAMAAVPMVEVEREREIVEWECPPSLLARATEPTEEAA
jgi:hypothetical protein